MVLCAVRNFQQVYIPKETCFMNNSDSRQSSAHLAVSTEFHSKQTIAVWVNQAHLTMGLYGSLYHHAAYV